MQIEMQNTHLPLLTFTPPLHHGRSPSSSTFFFSAQRLIQTGVHLPAAALAHALAARFDRRAAPASPASLPYVIRAAAVRGAARAGARHTARAPSLL